MGVAGPLQAMRRDLAQRVGQGVAARSATFEKAAVRSLGHDGLTLSAAARNTLRAATVLDESKLANLDAHLNTLTDLSPRGQQLRADFHRPIYADVDLQGRATETLHRWVLGGKDKLAVQEAFTNVAFAGKSPNNDMERTLLELVATRRDRWQRLSAREAVPMPDQFKLYRGVRGDYAVDEVLRGWLNDGTSAVSISHHELTSWSTNRQTAETFMSGTPAAVLYEADIPFEQTLADKWVDGGSFVAWCPDQNEVVVSAARDTLSVPKERIQVTYQDRTYSYAERHDLLRAWNANAPVRSA